MKSAVPRMLLAPLHYAEQVRINDGESIVHLVVVIIILLYKQHGL
jgi:hypothetical protein